MFASKAGAYPSRALFRCSTLGYAPGLAAKHKTRLEKSLPGTNARAYLNDGRKKFYNIRLFVESLDYFFLQDASCLV